MLDDLATVINWVVALPKNPDINASLLRSKLSGLFKSALPPASSLSTICFLVKESASLIWLSGLKYLYCLLKYSLPLNEPVKNPKVPPKRPVIADVPATDFKSTLFLNCKSTSKSWLKYSCRPPQAVPSAPVSIAGLAPAFVIVDAVYLLTTFFQSPP